MGCSWKVIFPVYFKKECILIQRPGAPSETKHNTRLNQSWSHLSTNWAGNRSPPPELPLPPLLSLPTPRPPYLQRLLPHPDNFSPFSYLFLSLTPRLVLVSGSNVEQLGTRISPRNRDNEALIVRLSNLVIINLRIMRINQDSTILTEIS